MFPLALGAGRHGSKTYTYAPLGAWRKLHTGMPRQEGEVQVLSILAEVPDPT